MAEERNFFQKLLNPTEEEKNNIIKQIEEGRKYSRILDKEGFKGLITRSSGPRTNRRRSITK